MAKHMILKGEKIKICVERLKRQIEKESLFFWRRRCVTLDHGQGAPSSSSMDQTKREKKKQHVLREIANNRHNNTCDILLSSSSLKWLKWATNSVSF